MAKPVSKYTIELDFEPGEKIRESIDGIERELKAIGDSAKEGLGKAIEDAGKSAEDLVARMSDLAKEGKLSARELEAFNKSSAKAISSLEKQATMLRFSLSEQGKAQRERLGQIKAELDTIQRIGGDKKRQKALEAEMKALQKDVIEGTDEQLEASLKLNKSIRARLTLAKMELKAETAQVKTEKTLASLVKDDLKTIKEKIKAQLDFIKSLKKTEVAYKGIKKLGGTAIKGAAIGATALAGGALALGAMAVGNANAQVEREREANRIKADLTKDEKQELISELYISTGRDATSIVDAVNRVASVLGTAGNFNSLREATVQELRYPGTTAILRQQNTGTITANDYTRYGNRLRAIQSATGATVDQIQESSSKVANMRQSNFGKATEAEVQAIHLALANSGAYDSQEEADRAFDLFMRAYNKSAEDNILEFAKTYFDDAKTATRGVYGATNKQQAITALRNLDWYAVKNAVATDENTTKMSAAETTAMKMRAFEEKKNKLLMRLVEAIAPAFEKIDDATLDAFCKAIAELAEILIPFITDVVIPGIKFLMEKGAGAVSFLADAGSWLAGKVSGAVSWFTGDSSDSTPQRANGGLASMPSICGEAGPEMVVPLDYSRHARGVQLTEQLTQHFHMSGNQTTALSLSQAVKSRDFTRAMVNNSWLAGRLGR